MTHTHAKGQGQRSLGSRVRVEAGRMEAIALPPMLMWLVITRMFLCILQVLKCLHFITH